MDVASLRIPTKVLNTLRKKIFRLFFAVPNFDEPSTSDGGFVMTRLNPKWKIVSQRREELKEVVADGGITLRPGEYEIILIVDAMEVAGGGAGGKQSRKTVTIEELETLQVRYETKKLSIGDFIWVARPKSGRGSDLVLPYVVERKRMDDLRSSIMDGRYKEQKQRLNQCGLPNKYYLVEEIYANSSKPIWQGHENQGGGGRAIDRSVLEQAMSNTCIRDGFNVRKTKSQKESMKFLKVFTDNLKRKYEGITLKSCRMEDAGKSENHLLALSDFHEFSRPDKPLKLREIFSNMLVCLKGLSPSMSWAVTEKYPTPAALWLGYQSLHDEAEKEKLLAGIPYDDGKKIPLAVSKNIYWLYNSSVLN